MNKEGVDGPGIREGGGGPRVREGGGGPGVREGGGGPGVREGDPISAEPGEMLVRKDAGEGKSAGLRGGPSCCAPDPAPAPTKPSSSLLLEMGSAAATPKLSARLKLPPPANKGLTGGFRLAITVWILLSEMLTRSWILFVKTVIQ